MPCSTTWGYQSCLLYRALGWLEQEIVVHGTGDGEMDSGLVSVKKRHTHR